jgi:hypothetical protein
MRNEYQIIPIHTNFLIQGYYLDRRFTLSVSRENQEFRDLFFAPVTHQSPSGAHQFHKQMQYLKANCPSLADLPALPEPKEYMPPKQTEDFVDFLEVMRLHLQNAIYDLKEGQFNGA